LRYWHFRLFRLSLTIMAVDMVVVAVAGMSPSGFRPIASIIYRVWKSQNERAYRRRGPRQVNL
jgi:hypothetical protein